MKNRSSNIFWGIFLLLLAAFLLLNQLTSFTNIGIGSLILTILSIALIVQCISKFYFALLPIPMAVLYIIFQASLGLPFIQTRTLIISSILAAIGLLIIFPKRKGPKQFKFIHSFNSDDQNIKTENINYDNNPSLSVNFGAKSNSLKADNLETVQLYCNFGALEVFLDQAELSPNGAEVLINCSFGAIKLFVPKHWKVIDRINCTLGGVDMDRSFSAREENAPTLTLTGNVSFGGIEIRGL